MFWTEVIVGVLFDGNLVRQTLLTFSDRFL